MGDGVSLTAVALCGMCMVFDCTLKVCLSNNLPSWVFVVRSHQALNSKNAL